MIRFKELVGSGGNDVFVTDWSKQPMRLSDLGAVTFGRGVTDKNEARTPHYEIRSMLDMYETLPVVNSAINQLLLFLIPNKDVKIASSDKKTVEFLEKWYEQRNNVIDEYRNILLTNIICGNGYLEQSYAKLVAGGSVLDNCFSINDAGRIYVNPDSTDGHDAFIFELPIGIKQFMYMGELKIPGFYNVQYIKNYNFFIRRVYGVPLDEKNVRHYKTGWSRDNLYGRSVLVSAIDASNVFKEILSSWDTIARTRQLDQKILTVADSETGMNIDQKRLDKLGEELENNDKSFTLFNVPLKLLSQDIEVSGKYDLMEGVMDSLRRMIMMGLLPQHLTPWSDSATTQGSESAMPPFLGRVKAKQNEFIKFLDTHVINELRKTYSFIAKDATHVFEEPKVMSNEYYVRLTSDLINSGILTAKQGQKYLTQMGVIDEDLLLEDKEFTDDSNNENDKNKDNDNKHVKFETVVKENVTQTATVGFQTFKKRLETKDKKIKTTGWKEVESSNIGGKSVRLVQSGNNIILFDGLNLVDTYNLDEVQMKTVKQAYDDYKQKLRDLWDNFKDEELPEDKIIDELNKQIKKDMDEELNSLFKILDNNQVKKEGFSESFFGDNILNKLGNVFSGFSTKVNKGIGSALSKLNLTVVDDESDSVKVDDHTKDMLNRKKDLLKKNLQLQIVKTKDDILKDIKSDLIKGMAAGKDAKSIKQEIEQKFNYKDGVGWKVDRMINSQLRDAATILKLRKWDMMGMEEFEWITRDDAKVRESHQKKHHRVFKIKDALNARTDDWDAYPGKAANCRCAALLYS